MVARQIAIDTKTLVKPVGKPVWVKIGGEIFEAKCPKDAVLAKIYESEDQSYSALTQMVSAMIGSENGKQVAEMLDDEDNDEVSLRTLSDMITWLMSDPDGPQWEKALTESLKELGSGEAPKTVAVKRAPAKKTAVRRR